MSTYQQGYYKRRTQGGLKGLGTGARSALKGRMVQIAKNQARNQQAYIPRFRYSNMGHGKEIKCVDHTFEAAWVNPYVPDILAKTMLNIDSTGQALQALMIQQGTGPSQRVGNRCKLKSIRIRFQLLPTGNDFDNNVYARLMIIYDRQPNGVYPTVANILANLNESGTTSGFDWLASLNVNNLERFVVLMDHYVSLQPYDNALNEVNTNQIGGTTSECLLVDKYIKLRGLEQTYSAQSAPMVIANQTIGALYIFSLGSPGAASSPWTWSGSTRIRFWDY